jgi:putative peptidoglycan lipid II flippase
VILAWGAVVGSLLQLLWQLPTVLQLVPELRFRLEISKEVRTTIRNFVPVFISRGVVQISAYIDGLLASLLPTGAVTGMANAQLLYTLPVSLFGLSVSAAELPAMSGAAGFEATQLVRDRLNRGLRRIAFFVVPSAMAFFALGDIIAAALFQTGRFTRGDAIYVWGILAGSAIGLLASTLGRLYSSTYYALRDTRTPLRYALLHVFLATVLGYVAAIVLPPLLGIPPRWGTVGLTASASIAAGIEFLMLRRTLNRRLGATGLPLTTSARLWAAAAIAAIVAWTIKPMLTTAQPIAVALLVLIPYGGVFIGLTLLLGIPEARSVFSIVRRSRGSSGQ